MNHTNEPWAISEYGNVISVDGRNIRVSGFTLSSGETSEANSRRIVAFVNACAGISTENLENILMLGDTLKTRIDENVKTINKGDKVLSALKRYVDHFGDPLQCAREAIANSEKPL